MNECDELKLESFHKYHVHFSLNIETVPFLLAPYLL